MTQSKITVADIIPLTKLKNNLDFFSYKVPDEMISTLKVGMLVEIPFRNKNVQGIVKHIKGSQVHDFKYDLKEIYTILQGQIYSPQSHLDILSFVSHHYLVSLANVAHSCIPEKPKKIHTISSPEVLDISVTDKAFSLIESPNTAVKYRDNTTKLQFIQSVEKSQKGPHQTLILAPRIDQAHEIYSLLSNTRENVFLYSPSMNMNEKFSLWNEILKNDNAIIIGTRSSIFLPFNNLKTIIVTDETYEEYIQHEPQPRYNTMVVVDKLKHSHNARLISLSKTFSIKTLEQIAIKDFDYLEIDTSGNSTIRIVDMGKEKVAKNFSMLSLPLQNEITLNLKNNEKSFLFLNKKGRFSGYMCANCKEVFGKEYNRNSCTECNEQRIVQIGKGIDALQEEVRNMFPNARIAVISSDNEYSDDQISEIISHCDICIGTEFVLSKLHFKDFSLAGVIYAESVSYTKDFKHEEDLLNSLQDLIVPFNNARIYIQTYSGESYLFSYIENQNIKDWFLHEISIRKKYNFPPYSKVLKVIIKGIDEKEVSSKEIKIRSALENITGNTDIGSSHVFISRSGFQKNLLLSFDTDYTFPPKLRELDCIYEILE